MLDASALRPEQLGQRGDATQDRLDIDTRHFASAYVADKFENGRSQTGQHVFHHGLDADQ